MHRKGMVSFRVLVIKLQSSPTDGGRVFLKGASCDKAELGTGKPECNL